VRCSALSKACCPPPVYSGPLYSGHLVPARSRALICRRRSPAGTGRARSLRRASAPALPAAR